METAMVTITSQRCCIAAATDDDDDGGGGGGGGEVGSAKQTCPASAEPYLRAIAHWLSAKPDR